MKRPGLLTGDDRLIARLRADPERLILFRLAHELHQPLREVESWPARLIDEWVAYLTIMRPPPPDHEG